MTQSKPEPLACSLDAREMIERGQELRALARRGLLDRARVSGGVRLEYEHTDAIEAALRELIRREHQCCPFLEFKLGAEAGRLRLDVSAPAGAESVLDALYEQTD